MLIQGYGLQLRYEYLLHCCIDFIQISVTLEIMENKGLYPSFLLPKPLNSICMQSMRILLCRIRISDICTGFS